MSAHRRIRSILKDQTSNIWIQLFRYGISGMSATVVDFVVLALLTELFGEDKLLIWTAIAFISGLFVTYMMSTKWVFDVRRMKSRAAEAGIFTLIGIVGLLLTELLMWVFAHVLDLHYLLSKLFASILVFIWNFTAKKTILFRK